MIDEKRGSGDAACCVPTVLRPYSVPTTGMYKVMARDEKPKYNPNKHHRKSNRLKGYDYTQPGAYFVTMVTYQRECLFGEIIKGEMKLNELGKVANECWLAIPDHFSHVELGM